jgi:hypothetical protein
MVNLFEMFNMETWAKVQTYRRYVAKLTIQVNKENLVRVSFMETWRSLDKFFL